MAPPKRAFSRGSAPETLTAIIRDEPEPIASLAPLTPTPLRWIVERCLSKSPEDRYASTRDLARDLSTLKDRLTETTSSGTLSSVAAAPVRRASKALRASPWVLALLRVLGLTWLLSSGSRTKAAPAAPLRFSVVLPRGVALSES